MGKRRANGEGSIRKRENGLWEGRMKINGIPKSVYGKTQAEVRVKLTEIRNALDNDEYFEPTDTTLKEWLELWQEEYLEDVKQSTADRYKSCIRMHIIPALGENRLLDLRSSMIQKFLNNCKRTSGLSEKSVKNIRLVLHKALEQAVEDEQIKKNPCDKAKVPSYDEPPKEMRPLKDNEVSAFLNAIIGHPLESLFYVATFTGMRESEIIGLSWDCIDFERGTIHLYRQLKKTRGKGGQYVFTSLKNKQARTFGVPQNVLDTLRRVKIKQAEWKLKAGSSWNNKDNLVFTDQLGKHIATHTVWRQFKVKVEEIGIPEMRFHDLRHPDVKQATKNNEHFIRISKSQENRYTIADTLSSVSISESILEGGFDFYPVIMKNMNFADSALR